MQTSNILLSVLTTLAVLGTIPFFALLSTRLAGAPQVGWMRTGLEAATGAAVTCAAIAGGIARIPALLVAPVAALGALFAVLSLCSLRTQRSRWAYAIAGFAVALVFLLPANLIFGALFDPFATRLGVLDSGGAVPVFVASAAFALAVDLSRASKDSVVAITTSTRSIGWPAIGIWLGSIAWMVGAELALDSATPVILVGMVVMPAVGTAVGALVERLRHRRNTVFGVVGGMFAGLGAAIAASAFLTPSLAAVTALISAGVVAVLPRRSQTSWLSVILLPLGVGGAIGSVLIGAFAGGVGFIHTGQPEVMFGQLLVAVIAIALGVVVGALVGFALKRQGRT